MEAPQQNLVGRGVFIPQNLDKPPHPFLIYLKRYCDLHPDQLIDGRGKWSADMAQLVRITLCLCACGCRCCMPCMCIGLSRSDLYDTVQTL